MTKSRSLVIKMDQQDDDSFIAWLEAEPTIRCRAYRLNELFVGLKVRLDEWAARGGDPRTLSVEIDDDQPI